MKFLSMITVCTVLFLSGEMAAAQLKITNKSTSRIFVMPKWDTRQGGYVALESGQSEDFDSGFYSIYEIRWAQLMPDMFMQAPGSTNMKLFKVSIDIKAATLKNQLDILNDGSYGWKLGPLSNYEVGTAGSGSANVEHSL